MRLELILALGAVAAAAAQGAFPCPFSRALMLQEPPLVGDDVIVLQNLLLRSAFVRKFDLTGAFDSPTAAALGAFQAGEGVGAQLGVLDAATAALLLELHAEDNYRDTPYLPAGAKYKVYVPVHRNRSIETTCVLFDANLTVLYEFTCRTHGQDDPASGEALGELCSAGATPTGLSWLDLNSPEEDPVSFGPYPVNRFITGVAGNQGIYSPAANKTFLSDVRDGILIHTGEWPGWNPSQPMPNSHGCIHCHPDDIKTIWLILVSLGVQVRNNTNGALPYPYAPQGVVSVELIDPPLPRRVPRGN
jgi:peptidoglycan hydrolase-like protein with peptidoglycan-binding domain